MCGTASFVQWEFSFAAVVTFVSLQTVIPSSSFVMMEFVTLPLQENVLMESFLAGTSLFFSNLLLLLFQQLSTTTQWTSILGTLNPTLLDVYILYAVLTLSLQDTQVAVHDGSLLVVGRVE
jgi:hypothetical protein